MSTPNHWRHFGALGAMASGIKVSSGGRELLVLDVTPNHRRRDLAIPRSRANKKARAVTVTAPASAYAANETGVGHTAKPKSQVRCCHHGCRES
jgi:hypothetical protein